MNKESDFLPLKTSNSEFIINDLSEEIKSLDLVADELLDIEKKNQITFDFGIPQSRIDKNEIKSKRSPGISEDETLNEQNIKKDKLFDEINENKALDYEIGDISNKVIDMSVSELRDVEVNDAELIDSSRNLKLNVFNKKIKENGSLESQKRMINLKEFNYSFKNSSSKIDELENEPAYKRNGLNLDEPAMSQDVPKTTIETDENDEIQLKSNNSFLHDNVD